MAKKITYDRKLDIEERDECARLAEDLEAKILDKEEAWAKKLKKHKEEMKKLNAQFEIQMTAAWKGFKSTEAQAIAVDIPEDNKRVYYAVDTDGKKTGIVLKETSLDPGDQMGMV